MTNRSSRGCCMLLTCRDDCRLEESGWWVVGGGCRGD